MKVKLDTPVSVVIPNYNGVELLKKNLPSVITELRAGDEVIVIDDTSTDDSLSWLRQFSQKNTNLEWVILSNETNLRFAASVNKAVKKAHHPFIWLLNNDVSPRTGALQALLNSFTAVDALFGVGSLEHEPHIQEIGGKNKLEFTRGLFVHSRASEFSTGETTWVSGGSGLFDREKWLILDGFDSRYYPAYWEDIDLSYRARKRGWNVWFCAESEVTHNHESTNATVFGQRKIDVISISNSLKFLWSQGSLAQKMQNLLWTPYHLTITNLKMKGAYGAGWLRWFLGTIGV